MTKQLKAPPIVEVVCGFEFPPIAGLDPMLVGKFWSDHLAHFPKRQLHHPVLDRPVMPPVEGLGPARVWLISANDEYIVQIQPDRFYFNWRKRDGAYPHFRDHDGRPGVLAQGLGYFSQLEAFCTKELGAAPAVNRLELAKVDLLAQGRHWQDAADLAQLLPVLAPLTKLARSEAPAVHMRLLETRGDQQVHVQLGGAIVAPNFDRALQIETRVLAPHRDRDLREAFLALNDVANGIFFSLVPESELHRFQGVTA